MTTQMEMARKTSAIADAIKWYVRSGFKRATIADIAHIACYEGHTFTTRVQAASILKRKLADVAVRVMAEYPNISLELGRGRIEIIYKGEKQNGK